MRVLLLSDVHGNLEALRAALEAASRWDEVVVLGDLVDYGPWPGEVIDEVRGLGARVVRGNHDHAVGYGVDCRCGEETHWLSVWFRENVTVPALSRSDRAWLAGLPQRLHLDLDGVEGLAVHGSPASPLYGYLYPWLGREALCSHLRPRARISGGPARCPERGLFLVGHTHVQFTLTLGGARVVNPGSVGQPRDGAAGAAYAVLDMERGTLELGRASYDVGRVVGALEALGVPDPYLSALKYMLYRASTPPPELRPREPEARGRPRGP